MLAPGQEYTLTPRGGTWLSLSIAPDFLSALMQPGDLLSGKPRSILSSELSLSGGARQALVRAVRRLLDAAESGPIGLDENPVEQELDRWLSVHLAGNPNVQFISPSSRARVRAMKAWIDRHFKEPISLEELCNALRMSKRSLQYLCMAGFGMTPMEVVQWRRLAAVRRALERAGPDTTVTDMALNNGFTHLGRFSLMYREVYGELPSATLARSGGGRGFARPLRTVPAWQQLKPRRGGLGHLHISPPGIESNDPGPQGEPPPGP
jgi:AraC-like DNA-binding protein